MLSSSKINRLDVFSDCAFQNKSGTLFFCNLGIAKKIGMKKISLFAGFFIIASSFPGLANTVQTDTLPGKTLQFYNWPSNSLRMSFYSWRNSQQRNLLIRPATINLQSQPYFKINNYSTFHLSWWPQVV
jgi:hypothetical protein